MNYKLFVVVVPHVSYCIFKIIMRTDQLLFVTLQPADCNNNYVVNRDRRVACASAWTGVPQPLLEGEDRGSCVEMFF